MIELIVNVLLKWPAIQSFYRLQIVDRTLNRFSVTEFWCNLLEARQRGDAFSAVDSGRKAVQIRAGKVLCNLSRYRAMNRFHDRNKYYKDKSCIRDERCISNH